MHDSKLPLFFVNEPNTRLMRLLNGSCPCCRRHTGWHGGESSNFASGSCTVGVDLFGVILIHQKFPFTPNEAEP